jgi:hypothetical protein
LFLFAKPGKINYFPAIISNTSQQRVFEIITDRRRETIEFDINIPWKFLDLWIGQIDSTKSAKVKATIDYSVGF